MLDLTVITNVVGNTVQGLIKKITSMKRTSPFYWHFSFCLLYKVLPQVYMLKFCSIFKKSIFLLYWLRVFVPSLSNSARQT